jgi:hypothetical protein
MQWGFVDWIHLAYDTNQWLAFVNTVMNRLFPQDAKNFLIT